MGQKQSTPAAAAAAASQQPTPSSELVSQLGTLDVDAIFDGAPTLAWEGFREAARGAEGQLAAQQLAELFALVDADGSGSISRDELEEFAQGHANCSTSAIDPPAPSTDPRPPAAPSQGVVRQHRPRRQPVTAAPPAAKATKGGRFCGSRPRPAARPKRSRPRAAPEPEPEPEPELRPEPEPELEPEPEPELRLEPEPEPEPGPEPESEPEPEWQPEPVPALGPLRSAHDKGKATHSAPAARTIDDDPQSPPPPMPMSPTIEERLVRAGFFARASLPIQTSLS